MALPPPAAAATAPAGYPIDPAIWRACTGTRTWTPSADSRVYYFPQGHAEHADTPPDLSSLKRLCPGIYCSVEASRLHVDPETEEPHLAMTLRPIPFDRSVPPPPVESCHPDDEEDGKVVMFSKVLTPSDANNGGGFSVPKTVADTIFPQLDYSEQMPVQQLLTRDLHGNRWVFRHVYRGTPRRHLLTTGWTKFVNKKNLVGGDSIVFMRKERETDVLIGIRRARRPDPSPSKLSVYSTYAGLMAAAGNEVFSTNQKVKVSPESVVEAIRCAEMDCPFEVVYYPRKRTPEFVVRADLVDVALRLWWQPMLKVRMATVMEESGRISWHEGTVASAFVHPQPPWPYSPWRLLQVSWHEPDVPLATTVSPWEVEFVPETACIPLPYTPRRKRKLEENFGSFTAEGSGMPFPMSAMHDVARGRPVQSGSNFSNIPVGMQGARQEAICFSSLSYSEPSNTLGTDSPLTTESPPTSESPLMETLQHKVNNESFKIDDAYSSHNDSSFQSESSTCPDREASFDQNYDSTENNQPVTFQLFGAVITATRLIGGNANTDSKDMEYVSNQSKLSPSGQHKKGA